MYAKTGICRKDMSAIVLLIFFFFFCLSYLHSPGCSQPINYIRKALLNQQILCILQCSIRRIPDR